MVRNAPIYRSLLAILGIALCLAGTACFTDNAPPALNTSGVPTPTNAAQKNQIQQASLYCSLIASGAPSPTGQPALTETIATDNDIFHPLGNSTSIEFAIAPGEDVLISANVTQITIMHRMSNLTEIDASSEGPSAISTATGSLDTTNAQYVLGINVAGDRLGDIKTAAGADSGEAIVSLTVVCRIH